jgi:uridine kinase
VKAEPLVKVIGIAGGCGSGKSTLAKLLKRYLGEDQCSVIRVVKSSAVQSSIADTHWVAEKRDCTVDNGTELLAWQIRLLKSGRGVDCLAQDPEIGNSKPRDFYRIKPRPIIIVEGSLILATSEIRSLLDVKVFVSTPDMIRYQRVLLRGVSEEDRTEGDIKRSWDEDMQNVHKEFCEPSKRFADVVIDGVSITEDTLPIVWGGIAAVSK